MNMDELYEEAYNDTLEKIAESDGGMAGGVLAAGLGAGATGLAMKKNPQAIQRLMGKNVAKPNKAKKVAKGAGAALGAGGLGYGSTKAAQRFLRNRRLSKAGVNAKGADFANARWTDFSEA